MECAFSEFSYGYAVTEELAVRFGARSLGPPVFPTQWQEAHLGYDVRIGPVFLQFKRPDVLERPRRLSPELQSPIRFRKPFFRMYLRKDNIWAQHRALRALEARYRWVRYAAPRFRSSADLARYYFRGQVTRHSALIRPTDVPTPTDSGAHYVAYARTGPMAYAFSSPQKLEHAMDGASFLASLETARAERAGEIGRWLPEGYFVTLLDDVWGILAESFGVRPEETDYIMSALARREVSAPYKVGYLCRSYLDAETLLL